mmetsp:Transcript_109292/g.303975  ORF Transcript_109292/g.303975 Transcript_109292/m.303975 type:complete len:137 (+) Transcript_109292:145-555(+)
MVPPKIRGKKKVRPDWGALFSSHYDTKGPRARTLKIRKVTACDTTEEDSKAGTCTCTISYEFEPCEPESTDCTDYGSEHKDYGEETRQVTFSFRDAGGTWGVTSVEEPVSADAPAAAAQVTSLEEDSPTTEEESDY